jgi:hypothetical protein
MRVGINMGEIELTTFSGMNNLKTAEGFYSKKSVVEPIQLANADVDNAGKILKRPGKTLSIALPGAYSGWSGISCALVAAAGKLYRKVDNSVVEIGSISGPARYPLSYAEADGKIYISNAYWNSIFNPNTNILSQWGVSQPDGPMLVGLSSGGLPAGTYNVTMTNVVNGELSGNGPISTIQLASSGGIRILNRPEGAIVWATESNSPIFFKIGVVDKILNIPTIEPLPSYLCTRPPFLENLVYAFGRMWGSVEKTLYYSEPFNLGWFKLTSNKFDFDSVITLIARTSTGLFIGCEDNTKFLAGTEPEKMQQHDVGSGSIPGSLDYCQNLPELGNLFVSKEKTYVDVPIWRTNDGIVVGSDSGYLYNLTKDRLKIGTTQSRSASLFRLNNGVFQFLTSAQRGIQKSGIGAVNDETQEIFEDGKIKTSNRVNSGASTAAGLTDTATSILTRGGVVIPE